MATYQDNTPSQGPVQGDGLRPSPHSHRDSGRQLSRHSRDRSTPTGTNNSGQWTFCVQSGDIVHLQGCGICMVYLEHWANARMLPYMMGAEHAQQAFLFNTPGPHHDKIKQLHRDLSTAHCEIQELQCQICNTEPQRGHPIHDPPSSPSREQSGPQKRIQMEDNITHARDMAPLDNHQGPIFTGPSLGNRLGTNPVRPSPMEVLEIIDLTMDDDEEPIPNTSYHKDKAPVG
jgi:hypothetical protein